MLTEEKALKAIQSLRKTEKKIKFDQTIDLIVNLKNFDVRREAFSVFIPVPFKVKEKKVAGFLEKKSKFIDTITKEEFVMFKEKKDMKKFVNQYDFFIANAKLMPAVATTFGRVLGPSGKMPSPQLGVLITEDEVSIKKLLEKINSVVKIKVKEPSIKAPIAKESLKDEQIAKNLLAVYNKLLETLPKKNENIKSVLIKLSMDKPVKVEF